jgi:Fe-S-cluster-containing hydrogenase component 2
LRTRKLDACIECGACEQACEDRYGVKRLSLNGRILGALDFVDACHTCSDQRCIDPCNFDAISFDVRRREVLINEANCTGCTLCALACPYDAIEMHELDEAPRLAERLKKQGALAFGDGAPRKARLRRIASKCDHCAYYADQACISACPTGALLEIEPADAFAQLPEQARAAAQAGFDRTAAIDIDKLNQSKAFYGAKALHLPELGRAKAPRAQVRIGFWWGLGLVALTAFIVEIGLRKLMPSWSLAYFVATKVDGIEPDLALGRVDYRPGCELAVNLGYLGTALMITSMFYVPRRRFGFMKNLGTLQAWFGWHVMSGALGPAFVVLHSAAKLDNWISIGFWSMIGTSLSGFLGRYLTTQLPERASAATVETLELDRALAQLRAAHPGVREADRWYEQERRRFQKLEKRHGSLQPKRGLRPKPGTAQPTFFGAIACLLWLLKDDLGRGMRLRALKRTLARAVSNGPTARRVRREAAQVAARLALLERRRVLLPRLEPLFRRWKAVHVPMAIVLTVIATIHITLALRAG